MPFQSALRRGELIFDDSTKEHESVVHTTGLMLPRARETTEYMYGSLGVPGLPKELLIPNSEWEPRIKEQEETKTRVSDVVDRAGLPCKNQVKTNYCWGNSPVHCVEISRVLANQPMVILSPASVCAPIKNFKNEGGWGKEALEYLIEKGCSPVAKWPANAIDEKYMTAETVELMKLYKAVGWYELRPRNYDEHISMLIHGIPVAVGLDYWGHEVTDYEAVWIDGEALPRFRNSYGMNWPEAGGNGYAIRRGNKKFADDAVCPAFARAA